MNNLNKIKSLTIVSFILFVIFSFSTLSIFDGYYGFYYSKKIQEKNQISKIFQHICRSEPISFCGSYTGFETGYGFFAPNVSSDFVYVLNVYDANGKPIKTIEKIPFKSKEAYVRFTSLNNMFLAKITDENNKKYNQYLDIVVKQIAKNIKRDYPKDYKMDVELYLYDYPSIINYNKGEFRKIVLIKKYNI